MQESCQVWHHHVCTYYQFPYIGVSTPDETRCSCEVDLLFTNEILLEGVGVAEGEVEATNN